MRIYEGDIVEKTRKFRELITPKKFNESPEDYLGLLSDLIRELAFETSHRIPDRYFIATARYLDAVLITNDKRMADLAKSLRLEAFYLVEESDAFFKLLEVSL